MKAIITAVLSVLCITSCAPSAGGGPRGGSGGDILGYVIAGGVIIGGASAAAIYYGTKNEPTSANPSTSALSFREHLILFYGFPSEAQVSGERPLRIIDPESEVPESVGQVQFTVTNVGQDPETEVLIRTKVVNRSNCTLRFNTTFSLNDLVQLVVRPEMNPELRPSRQDGDSVSFVLEVSMPDLHSMQSQDFVSAEVSGSLHNCDRPILSDF